MPFAAFDSVHALLIVACAGALLIAWRNALAARRLRAELGRERRRVDLALRAAKSGIVDWNPGSRTAWYSEGYKALLGYPPDTDTSGWQDFFATVHPEDRERVHGSFLAHLKAPAAPYSESPHEAIEYRVRRADGSYVWVQGMALSLRDEDGRVARSLAAITDITERRAQQQALRDQIQLTRDLIDGNPNPTYLKDADCRFAEVNAAWTRQTGFAREAAIGRTVLEIFPGERARVYDHQDRELLARGEGSSAIEVDVQRDDGRRYHYLMSKSILKRADGSVRGLVGTLTDITRIKEFETQLRDQVTMTRGIIDGNPNPIFLKDAQGRHLEVNAAWEDLTGFAAADVIGRTTAEIFPGDVAAPYVDQDRALLEGRESTRTDVAQVMRKVGLHTYIVAKSALRRSDGSVRGLVGTVTDVTQLKRIEAELRASREQALQAAHAKSAFLATMSHEIRTPLNGVLGMAGLLAGTGLSEEQREYVEIIRVSGDALLSAINDILDYSKIESGHVELEDEPLEPVRAIEESLGILGERARAKGLELIAEIDDAVPEWVRGDFGRLRQVLVNLVGNAVKFTERGEVVVGVRVAEPERAERAMMLEFRVADTGIGIASGRLDALFEAFTQADASTTRKYGGTGLGLAISKRLVEHMGGALRAQSEPRRGSTFAFNVPARRCDAPAVTAEALPPAEIAGRRILLVDDNATNLRILVRQMERWGAVPVAVSGGQDALELLARDAAFDAAVLDYHMPDMDGVMLAREIVRRKVAFPLLLLSSSMYRRAEEAEADLFAAQLLKPVRQQQLHAALGRALSGWRAQSRPSGEPARGAARVAGRPRLRVLVVDDVEVNRRLALALLRGMGCDADAASGGGEGVERALAGDYDVVLMDVQMPDIDGLEATRRIQQRLGPDAPRIVAMTASALAGDREKCLAAGMDDYVAKPLGPGALRGALERAGRGAIDWSRLAGLQACDGDGSMVQGAIDAFLRDAPRQEAALGAALRARDAAGLAAAAHALKGAAMNIGASAVAECCAEIEALALRGELDEAGQRLERLKAGLNGACRALATRTR